MKMYSYQNCSFQNYAIFIREMQSATSPGIHGKMIHRTEQAGTCKVPQRVVWVGFKISVLLRQ